jgi:hypothetical protein
MRFIKISLASNGAPAWIRGDMIAFFRPAEIAVHDEKGMVLSTGMGALVGLIPGVTPPEGFLVRETVERVAQLLGAPKNEPGMMGEKEEKG